MNNGAYYAEDEDDEKDSVYYDEPNAYDRYQQFMREKAKAGSTKGSRRGRQAAAKKSQEDSAAKRPASRAPPPRPHLHDDMHQELKELTALTVPVLPPARLSAGANGSANDLTGPDLSDMIRLLTDAVGAHVTDAGDTRAVPEDDPPGAAAGRKGQAKAAGPGEPAPEAVSGPAKVAAKAPAPRPQAAAGRRESAGAASAAPPPAAAREPRDMAPPPAAAQLRGSLGGGVGPAAAAAGPSAAAPAARPLGPTPGMGGGGSGPGAGPSGRGRTNKGSGSGSGPILSLAAFEEEEQEVERIRQSQLASTVPHPGAARGYHEPEETPPPGAIDDPFAIPRLRPQPPQPAPHQDRRAAGAQRQHAAAPLSRAQSLKRGAGSPSSLARSAKAPRRSEPGPGAGRAAVLAPPPTQQGPRMSLQQLLSKSRAAPSASAGGPQPSGAPGPSNLSSLRPTQAPPPGPGAPRGPDGPPSRLPQTQHAPLPLSMGPPLPSSASLGPAMPRRLGAESISALPLSVRMNRIKAQEVLGPGGAFGGSHMDGGGRHVHHHHGGHGAAPGMRSPGVDLAAAARASPGFDCAVLSRRVEGGNLSQCICEAVGGAPCPVGSRRFVVVLSKNIAPFAPGPEDIAIWGGRGQGRSPGPPSGRPGPGHAPPGPVRMLRVLEPWREVTVRGAAMPVLICSHAVFF